MTKFTTSEIEHVINTSDENIKVAMENAKHFYTKAPIVFRLCHSCAAHPEPYNEVLQKHLVVAKVIIPEIINTIELTHNVTATNGWEAFLCLAGAAGLDMLKNWMISAKKEGYSPLSISVFITISNRPENIRDFSLSFNIIGEQFNNDRHLLFNVLEMETDLVLADNNDDKDDESESD